MRRAMKLSVLTLIAGLAIWAAVPALAWHANVDVVVRACVDGEIQPVAIAVNNPEASWNDAAFTGTATVTVEGVEMSSVVPYGATQNFIFDLPAEVYGYSVEFVWEDTDGRVRDTWSERGEFTVEPCFPPTDEVCFAENTVKFEADGTIGEFTVVGVGTGSVDVSVTALAEIKAVSVKGGSVNNGGGYVTYTSGPWTGLTAPLSFDVSHVVICYVPVIPPTTTTTVPPTTTTTVPPTTTTTVPDTTTTTAVEEEYDICVLNQDGSWTYTEGMTLEEYEAAKAAGSVDDIDEKCGELPFTGFDTTDVAMIALAFLLVGGATLALVKRRREDPWAGYDAWMAARPVI